MERGQPRGPDQISFYKLDGNIMDDAAPQIRGPIDVAKVAAFCWGEGDRARPKLKKRLTTRDHLPNPRHHGMHYVTSRTRKR